MAKLRYRIALASSFVCAWLVVASGPEPAAAQTQGRQYSTAEIQGGYRLYASQCALCHGGNGNTIHR